VVGYDELASVYGWLTPEPLLTPEGSVAAFASVVDTLTPGARVLDCAAGTGQLAVGLALAGFDVTATDASGEMIARTRGLAADRGADLTTCVCTWEVLSYRARFAAELREAGLMPLSSAYAGDAERYLITAEMRSQPGLDRG
jgi:SAM-dependent methyltransferase